MNDQNLFDEIVEYPDLMRLDLYHRLVGLETVKERLIKEASIMIKPDVFKTWANSFHDPDAKIFEDFSKRPPLFIFAGDVGTGKSALAKSFGAEIAKTLDTAVELYPLSLESRGKGVVGEMTRLLSNAFREVLAVAKKSNGKKGVILLIDEADAVAQSRELNQMHHEDRAGVNTLLRGIDDISMSGLPVVIVMCTNRSNALDPAIKRRAAGIFEFCRPTEQQREFILGEAFEPLGFDKEQISELAKITGQGIPFTYSDITQRLLPSIVLSAFPNSAITFDVAKLVAERLQATPPFKDA